MKKENVISLLTLLTGFIIFIITFLTKSTVIKGFLAIIGISALIVSIVFENKAKNQNFGIFAILSKIAKSKKQ